MPLLGQRRVRSAADGRVRRGCVLLAGVAVTTVILNVVTGGGSLRDHSVRYALPLMVVIAPAVALFATAVSRGRPLVAAVVIACPLLYDVFGYPLVWSPFRHELALEPVREVALLDTLSARGVPAVIGNYWLVYPYNFVSRETIHGIPLEDSADDYRVADLAAAKPQRWALASRDRAELAAWTRRAGLGGAIEELQGVYVLIPEVHVEAGPPTAAFLGDLRAAFFARLGG